MTKEELLKYLKTAIDLETDIATQDGIIAAYNENSETRKPNLVIQKYPKEPIPAEYQGPDKNVGFCVGLGILCILSGLFIYVVGAGESSEAKVFMGMFITFGIIGVISLLVGIYKSNNVKSHNKEVDKHNQSAKKSYEERKKSIAEHNNNIRAQYNKDFTKWHNNDMENIDYLEKRREETIKVLKQLYENDFIYAKYRNLPALTSIYEYLLTGRCDELAGPYGAYNLYEDEVRKDTVICQLNTVIDNLEQIKQNQFMLYQQAKLIKNETMAISNELRQIRGYTANLSNLVELNTYYTALAARNTEISAKLLLLNGR